eukprot:1577443-Pyramimonas_sp.AAC.1
MAKPRLDFTGFQTLDSFSNGSFSKALTVSGAPELDVVFAELLTAPAGGLRAPEIGGPFAH